MTRIEVDHVFVFSALLAPEADEMVTAGFTEGSANVHAGQGTACRRFFFENGMLEFLYVTDLEVTRGPAAAGTGLAERWTSQGSGASPFGICFRPLSGDNVASPFPAWTYGPAYLPGGTRPYQVSQRCRLIEEPFIFYMPTFLRPDQYPAQRAQPMDHPCGARAITQVRLDAPHGALTDLQDPAVPLGFQVKQAPQHHLHVELDQGRQDRSLTLTSLPLSLTW